MSGDRSILKMRVSTTSYQEVADAVFRKAQSGDSGYVCVANVHMVMEAFDDPQFRSMVNAADIVTPDGMPLVWMLRALGVRGQRRVYGPELTLRICEQAARDGVPVGFYGSTDAVLDRLQDKLPSRFPGLEIAYRYSPAFTEGVAPLYDNELERINTSGARVLFVGLGCPKQENWMHLHRDRVRPVMLGVGAAFDFHAGTLSTAPGWMQSSGLEWFHRLMSEPKRLWRRYGYHNPRYVVFSLLQLLRLWDFHSNSAKVTVE